MMQHNMRVKFIYILGEFTYRLLINHHGDDHHVHHLKKNIINLIQSTKERKKSQKNRKKLFYVMSHLETQRVPPVNFNAEKSKQSQISREIHTRST